MGIKYKAGIWFWFDTSAFTLFNMSMNYHPFSVFVPFTYARHFCLWYFFTIQSGSQLVSPYNEKLLHYTTSIVNIRLFFSLYFFFRVVSGFFFFFSSANDNSKYLLNAYCVPDAFISALHVVI